MKWNAILGITPTVQAVEEGLGFTRPENDLSQTGDETMLKWAAIFLVIALIAALLGFTSIAGAAAGIAKFLFFLFIAIFVIFFVLAIMGGRKMF